ncbi:MAG TPA: outer membrane beta-barrel protein [Gemmatimonadales bacterium]|nr:outer membrane beta-barrel protein [Gemmatimonadales bacterium]
MRRWTAALAAAAAMAAVTAGEAAAQQWGAWGGQVYAGYATPLSEGLKNYTNGGFSWGAGLRFSPEDAIWGIRFDIRNTRLPGDEAAIRKTLDSLGVEEAFNKDGYFRTWDFALAGELGTSKDNKIRAYVLGGVNFSNKYSAITEPTLVGGCWWDPWWGYICGSGVGDLVLAKRNQWEFGWNAGGGISFDMGRGASLFVEAVYTSIAGSNVDTNNGATKSSSVGYLPIYLGVRF